MAILSFVCSVGNVPLAAVLWRGGISFGGVVSFIFADLIVLPVLDIYRKYYGWKVMGYILATFYVTMAAAGYVIEIVFGTLGHHPDEPGCLQDHRGRPLELHERAQHRLPRHRAGARHPLPAHGRSGDAQDDEHAE